MRGLLYDTPHLHIPLLPEYLDVDPLVCVLEISSYLNHLNQVNTFCRIPLQAWTLLLGVQIRIQCATPYWHLPDYLLCLCISGRYFAVLTLIVRSIIAGSR